MEARILDAMRECKQEIEDEALKDRCDSRVTKMNAIVTKYERTLDPHDFCASMEDVCRLPDIRKVIIDGTDEEFNACAEELTSRLPELTSHLLEERTTKMTALFPSSERPGNIFLFATGWFKCGMCYMHPMHAADALRHYCRIPWCYRPEKPVGETTLDNFAWRRSWCGETHMLQFSEVASTLARKLILECGEDPDSITLAEMDARLHRFGFYKNTELAACNWREMVSSAGFVDA